MHRRQSRREDATAVKQGHGVRNEMKNLKMGGILGEEKETPKFECRGVKEVDERVKTKEKDSKV